MQSAPSSPQVHIRPSTPHDAATIAHLHLDLLPHGFFAKLGSRYLAAYHRTFMASPHAISFVACREDRVVGFIAGALDAHAHQRWTLRRRGGHLVVRGLAALAARPRLGWEFLTTRTGRYLRSMARAARPTGAATGASPSLASGPVAVLTHVAIDRSEQGGGAGSKLVDAFVESVRSAGTRRAELVTLCDSGASAFYERLGWTAAGEHEREGASYRRFTLEVS